jgi:hypothetical protein
MPGEDSKHSELKRALAVHLQATLPVQSYVAEFLNLGGDVGCRA